MLTLYARQEPTKDQTARDHLSEAELQSCFDVVLYRNPEATDLHTRFGWHVASKPDRRNKYVTINCYRWKLEWLPALLA